MTREEALSKVKGYLTDYLPSDNYGEVEEIVKALEQEPILDKIRAEIAEYGSICVEYKLTGRSDKDIEQLITDVLKQAKKQVLDVIDKYKSESEDEG